jgi:hypothetical protein
MATIGSFSRDNIATIVALRALAARFDAPKEKRARRLTGALFALARGGASSDSQETIDARSRAGFRRVGPAWTEMAR